MKELWQRKQPNVAGQTKAPKASLAKVEEQIEQAVKRIVEITVPAVMRALNEKVQRLESDKLLLREKIEN